MNFYYFALKGEGLGKISEPLISCERFERAISEYEEASTRDTIGVLNEKMLHSIIKSCIATSSEELEVCIGGRNYADVLIGNTAYEIQTESLFPVKKKLDFYFSSTDHDVNIVFPVAAEKYVCWIDPESGEASKLHRSPKKRSLVDHTDTLIYLTEFIGDPRLTLTVLYISECEYRNLDGKRSLDKKRGSTRIERRPLSLLSCEELKSKDDYRFLLPSTEVFTAKAYAKEKKLRSKRRIAYAIKMMLALGFISVCGKDGRAILYRVEGVNKNEEGIG